MPREGIFLSDVSWAWHFPSSAVHFSPFCSLVWAGLTIFAPSLVRGSGFGEALFGVCSPAFFTDFIRAFTHMSCILLIDTSTAACSVALCEDTQVIYADEDTQDWMRFATTYMDEVCMVTDDEEVLRRWQETQANARRASAATAQAGICLAAGRKSCIICII